MSSTGQVLGGVVGAVVGFFTPVGPWLGAQIGMSIGGYIDPPKGPTIEGPRIDDLSVQTSTYGAPIPRIYGTAIIAGNVFWLENNQLKEVRTETESGKGGPQQTSVKYSYYATFAVGLCEGPIVGVRRIWIGSNLIYNAGSNDAATISASSAAAAGFRVHLGSDDQLPDERIQAALGIDNTPAWRGLAYIVFDDFLLEKYGNTLAGAQVRVEVIKKGVVYDYPATTFSQPSRTWTSPAFDGTVFCSASVSSFFVIVSADGLNWTELPLPAGTSPTQQGVASDGAGTLLVYGAGTPNIWRSTDHGSTWTGINPPSFSGFVTKIVWNGLLFMATTDSGNFFTSPTGVLWTPKSPPVAGTTYGNTLVWHGGSNKWYVHNYISGTRYIWASATNGLNWTQVYTFAGDLNNFEDAATHNNRLIFMGIGTVSGQYGGCFLWSDDGDNWNLVAIPSRANPLVSDGENLWLGEYGGILYYSASGIADWVQYTAPTQGNLNAHGSCYANGMIVCLARGATTGFRIVKGSLYPSTSFDYATVTLERAFLTDWASPPVGTLNLFSGRVAQSQFSRSEIKLTVKSWIEILNIRMPRNLYQAGCLNVVYDAGCALNRATYTVTGTITAGNGTRNWLQGGPSGYADGYFNGGIMTFGAGQNYCRRTIVTQVGQTWTLSAPLPNPVAAGQTFTALAGCDRTLATCKARNNSQRFRGMPFIPVPEKAM